MSVTTQGGDEMNTAAEGKTLTIEIAEMLQNATKEQKLIIKGILMGANALDSESKVEKPEKEEVE